MKPAATAILVLLALVAAPAYSQSQAGLAPTGVEPSEPEILFPKVVLEIEDLSVEKVEAKLPPEDELLPPERALPVLSEGDMAVGEPALPGGATAGDASASISRDRLLSSDVALGAGMQNQVVGSVSLKTLGPEPLFSLLFTHETADGISGQRAGAGYSLRDDILRGALRMRIGTVLANAEGSFVEDVYGLQGRSAPMARLSRTVSAAVDASVTPADWLTLSASLEGGSDSLILEGGVTSPMTAYRIAPALSASARFDPAKIGLSARYVFRADPAGASAQLHRFQTDLSLGIDLPASFILEGSLGWFWSSAGLSLFPFTFTLTGTPFDFITLAFAAGYRVSTWDMREVLAVHHLALPAALSDDSGWFSDAAFQFSFTRELSAAVSLSFASSDAMLDMSTAKDPATGLFPTLQRSAFRFSTDTGLRWGITQDLSVSAGWTHQYLEVPSFVPGDSLRAEIVALDSTGRFGGNASFALAPAVTGVWQLPVLRTAGFWKITDAVKLQLDADDLLWWFIPDGTRWDVPPYVRPGFRFTGKVGISL